MAHDRMFHVIVLGGMGLVACGGLATANIGAPDGSTEAAEDGFPAETKVFSDAFPNEGKVADVSTDSFPSELPARTDAFPSESDPAPDGGVDADAFPIEGPVHGPDAGDAGDDGPDGFPQEH